jgi:two-component system chemotaxis sensor kinase CheA
MVSQDDFVSAVRAEYLNEAAFLLDRCEAALLGLETSADRTSDLAELFRALHTIKGSGASVGFECLVQLAHVMEDLLSLIRTRPDVVTTDLVSLLLRGVDALNERVKGHKEGRIIVWDASSLMQEFQIVATRLSAANQIIPFGDAAPPKSEPGFGFFDDEPAAPTKSDPKAAAPAASEAAPASAPPAKSGASIKVDAQRIDAVLDVVGELVIAKSQLLSRLDESRIDPALQGAAALLDTIVRDLQDRAMSIRMTPLKPLFLKLQRLARDLSLRCGKKIEFVMAGDDTELDRLMVDELADPLMHMMRNAIDHGIEVTEKRQRAGKPETGIISITARQVGGRVEIEMRDDGGGLPKGKIIAKALERGLIASPPASDREAFNLIFKPGLSTAEKVSDVSGRGVGMDVVKTNIERLHGTVEVRSEEGRGTTFILSLPLTAAISDGILVTVAGQPLLVPIDSVRDLAEPESKLLDKNGGLGRDIIRLKGRILPLVDLHDLVARPRNEGSSPMLVVVESEGRQAALLVESIIGQMQVVLKPLTSELCRGRGLAGAAIMGDGRVALVLDVQSLLIDAKEAEKEAA